MTHKKEICQYGTVHKQCRCASKNDVVVRISCTTPERCNPNNEPNPVGRNLVVSYVAAGWQSYDPKQMLTHTLAVLTEELLESDMNIDGKYRVSIKLEEL